MYVWITLKSIKVVGKVKRIINKPNILGINPVWIAKSG